MQSPVAGLELLLSVVHASVGLKAGTGSSFHPLWSTTESLNIERCTTHESFCVHELTVRLQSMAMSMPSQARAPPATRPRSYMLTFVCQTTIATYHERPWVI